MATLHLLHGFIGSGKTTFAKELAAKHQALRLSPDEWMSQFYGTNPPAETFAQKEQTIKAKMIEIAEVCLTAGCDVIFDFGLWTRKDRDAYRTLAAKCGASPILYALTCPLPTARHRALTRTENAPPGELFIDANAFDTLLAQFEPLAPDEAHITIKTDDTPPHT